MKKIYGRALRAALFRREPFREAFFDNDAAADGAIIVATVSAVSYLGALAYLGIFSSFDLRALLQVVVAAVASWLILAFATWGAATWLFGSSARPQTMVGVQGLAALPLVFEFVQNQLVGGLVLLWYLALLGLATKEVVSLDWKKTAVSVLIGLAAAVLVRALFSVPFLAFGRLFG